MTDAEKRDYLQGETLYELERMMRDEREDHKELEDCDQVQKDYHKSLGVK